MKFYGKLFWWNDQGMEGGFLAFQDQRFFHYEEDMIDGKCPYGPTENCPIVTLKNVEGINWKLQHSSYDGTHVVNPHDTLTVWEDASRQNILFKGHISHKKMRKMKMGLLPEWCREKYFARLKTKKK